MKIILILALSILMTSCANIQSQQTILGSWVSTVGEGDNSSTGIMTYYSDSTFHFISYQPSSLIIRSAVSGRWDIKGEILTMKFESTIGQPGSEEPAKVVILYIDDKRLVMKGVVGESTIYRKQ